MAERPVFVSTPAAQARVETRPVVFKWFPGLSVSQKQKSIESLHGAAQDAIPQVSKILEVSSKSKEALGVALSAFNLRFTTSMDTITLSVECAFQGSKVFEGGGPYMDIFELSSAKPRRMSAFAPRGGC